MMRRHPAILSSLVLAVLYGCEKPHVDNGGSDTGGESTSTGSGEDDGPLAVFDPCSCADGPACPEMFPSLDSDCSAFNVGQVCLVSCTGDGDCVADGKLGSCIGFHCIPYCDESNPCPDQWECGFNIEPPICFPPEMPNDGSCDAP
jgi:hypothetical protein